MSIKIIVGGCGGWMPHGGLLTSCLIFETEKAIIVLDMGSGFARIFEHPEILNKGKTIYIILSHAHPDHVNGLFFLLALPKGTNVVLIGSEETLKGIQPLLDAPLGVPIEKLKGKINLVLQTVEPGAGNGIVENYLYLKHSVPCVGYRLSIEEKTVAYCTDTGLCPNLRALIEGADCGIIECTWTDPDFEDLGHLNPRTAATVAVMKNIRQVFLTHYTGKRDDVSAVSFSTRKDIKKAEKIAQKIFPHTTALTDGMVLEI